MATMCPMASDPNRMRVRPNDVMSANPNPATADADGPIARRPGVFRTRSDRNHFNLGCGRSLGHHGGIRRRWSWRGRGLNRWRRLWRNRGRSGIWCLRGRRLICRLRLVSVARPGLINGSRLIDRCGLVSRDIFYAPFGAPGEYGSANGRKGQYPKSLHSYSIHSDILTRTRAEGFEGKSPNLILFM
jgi:hypothetical protein